ncbi:CD320 antigen [Pelodytes ibericus]
MRERGFLFLFPVFMLLAWQPLGETTASGSLVKCHPSQFQCRDGECIPRLWRCDGDNDCPEGEDEVACPQETSCSGFRCPDGRCLALTWKCDGYSDCADGSDEDPQTCGNVTCPHDKFQCLNGQCLSSKLVCNGQNDCKDGSDEQGCPHKQCSHDEFLCGPDCLPITALCDGKIDCDGGLDESEKMCKTDSKTHCLTDEFLCDDQCVPLMWRCDGHTDCEDESDENQCGTPPSLLIFNNSIVTKVDLTGVSKEDMQFTSSRITAISVDLESSEVFWIDGEERGIFRNFLFKESERRAVAQHIGIAACMAVDWVYKLVFWIDSESQTISVTSFDGLKRRILYKDSISLPSAMAVDPVSGYIFWSDMGNGAKIEKGAINGENRTVLVTIDIQRPVALTLDIKHSFVYWADGELNTISKIGMDGQYRKVVLHSANFLAKPSGIVVFQDKIFWSDLHNDAIYSIPKHQHASVTKVTSMHHPSGILILAREVQPDVLNVCLERRTKCPFLCVPAPANPGISTPFSCLEAESLDTPHVLDLPESVNSTIGQVTFRAYSSTVVIVLSVFFSLSLISCMILHYRTKTGWNLLNSQFFEKPKKYLKPDLDRTTSSAYMLSDLKNEDDDV